MAAAFAQAADHFFVGQHRAQRRAPIHRRLRSDRPADARPDSGARPRRPRRPRRAESAARRSAGPCCCCGVEPGVEQHQKDPLRPAEIVDVGGGQLAAPVVAEAEHLLLPAERGDVLFGGDPRRRAGLVGVLLGRQAEGVPAHRVQHALAAHPLDSGRRCRWPFAPRDGRRAGRRRWDRGTCRARRAFRRSAAAAWRTFARFPNTFATSVR